MAQARINRALRWSDYGVERDMPVPEVSGNTKTAGASTPPLALFIRHGAELRFTAHGKRRGCRCNLRRMRGMNGSQNGIPQYSTKERALKALRCSLEIKFAMQLDAIDKAIAKEIELSTARRESDTSDA